MLFFHKEQIEPKKPTLRQWIKETYQGGVDISFCHPVSLIFEPNKYPEYGFVTEFYRYSIKSSSISKTELTAITSQEYALCVVAFNGECGLTISSELLPNFIWHNAKGTWREQAFGFNFVMNETSPSPTLTPWDITFKDDEVRKKRSKAK